MVLGEADRRFLAYRRERSRFGLWALPAAFVCLVGAWVDEVRRACEPFLGNGADLTLDFTRVSFVDRDGVALCRELRRGHASLRNCSPFVKEQIDG